MYEQVILNNTAMATISFKADDQFKKRLEMLAKSKGINISAYIKLNMTEAMNKELSRVTENGMTVAEELEILHSMKNDEVFGPFESTVELLEALNKDDK